MSPGVPVRDQTTLDQLAINTIRFLAVDAVLIIGEHGSVREGVAHSFNDIEQARLLTLRAAWVKGQGQRFSNEAAIAKLTASEAAMFR